jgi:CheY-like chemotaxis protein
MHSRRRTITMGKTILYIDDEPYFVRSLVEALEDEGYTVDQATDGTEAIEKLMGSVPDLIILDIIMPPGGGGPNPEDGRRTGLKDHEIIRGELGLRTPIIFVTVVDDPEAHTLIRLLEHKHGIEDGAILVKPVLPTELIEQVKSTIGEA